jgi:hypothetical protein
VLCSTDRLNLFLLVYCLCIYIIISFLVSYFYFFLFTYFHHLLTNTFLLIIPVPYGSHGNLSAVEQKSVFELAKRGELKIVVSTNVAEVWTFYYLLFCCFIVFCY